MFGRYVHFVHEDETGHSKLLRAALRSDGQVAYLYAEDVADEHGRHSVRVHTDPSHAPPPGLDW
jgi:hypothetical protein